MPVDQSCTVGARVYTNSRLVTSDSNEKRLLGSFGRKYHLQNCFGVQK